MFSAEFRGPGVHHNYEDSDSGYELDQGESKGKSFGVGGYRGRIIFLGDGTEVLTDSDDTEMFDNVDEDKDLESQVSKTPSATGESKTETATESNTTSKAADGAGESKTEGEKKEGDSTIKDAKDD